jgi:hypothetical protein
MMMEYDLHAQLAAAIKDLEVAIAKSDRLEERISGLLQELAKAQIALAAAQGTHEGLRGQLETERQARTAITEAFTKYQQPAPTRETPAFEVIVGDRDLNGRMQQLTIRPKKGS